MWSRNDLIIIDTNVETFTERVTLKRYSMKRPVIQSHNGYNETLQWYTCDDRVTVKHETLQRETCDMDNKHNWAKTLKLPVTHEPRIGYGCNLCDTRETCQILCDNYFRIFGYILESHSSGIVVLQAINSIRSIE